MQWIDNNLIDDKNKFLVGYNEGGDCCDSASITVYDNEENDITHDDLTDWEFAEFPELDADCYYSANYWTEKME